MSNSTEPNLTGRAAASKRAPESVLYIHTYIGTSHLCVRARSGIERAEVQPSTYNTQMRSEDEGGSGTIEATRANARLRALVEEREGGGERVCVRA